MVEIADIRDRESLEAWLEDQPRETAISIACRAAARVLPVWWEVVLTEEWARRSDLTALPILRSLIISWVAANGATEETGRVARVARVGRLAAGSAANIVAYAANTDEATPNVPDVFAAANAADAAVGAAAEAAAYNGHTSTAASAAALAHASAGEAVHSDCATLTTGESLTRTPLWHDRPNPLQERWDAVTARLRDDPPPGGPWDFWRDWYQGLLDGTPMDPDLLTRIALIAPEHWDAGPERVNPMIHDMRELFELREEAGALRAEKEALLVRTASERQRSHNQPPELLDTEPELARQITIVWNGLDEAEAELAKEKPDGGRLAEIARSLLSALTAVGRYLVSLGDTALKAGATAAGTAGGVWIVDHSFNSGRIWDFATRLLNFAGGG